MTYLICFKVPDEELSILAENLSILEDPQLPEEDFVKV